MTDDPRDREVEAWLERRHRAIARGDPVPDPTPEDVRAVAAWVVRQHRELFQRLADR